MIKRQNKATAAPSLVVLACSALVFGAAVASTSACDSGRLQPQDGGVEPDTLPLPIVDGGNGPGVPEPSVGPGAEPDSDGGEPDVGPGVEPDADGGVEPDPQPSDGGTPGVDGGGPIDAGPPGPIYSIAAEGEPCYAEGGTPCEEGLQCAPIFNSGAGTCAQSCDVVDAPCPSGGICTDLPNNGTPNLICADRAAEGEGCRVEDLLLCDGDGACLRDDTEPLGATCRTRCTCAQGETSCAGGCTSGSCVVVDPVAGTGFCGAPRAIGESCSPTANAQFCEGDAACVVELETPEAGTCRARCNTPGDADSACLALATPHACFGTDNAGTCLPTTNRTQGEVCTTGTPAPEIALSCAAGFACLSVHADDNPGFGRCLRDCSGGQADCVGNETCFSVENLAPGGGNRCITELPRGTQGCDPPEPNCDDTCVLNADGNGICRLSCTVANCPGGTCECGPSEECLGLLADPATGICGTTVERGEACDEDQEVFCADAPNQDVDNNAFSVCLTNCYFVCEFDPADGPVVNLDCPAGLECAADPTGRLLPTVKVCVDPPQP